MSLKVNCDEAGCGWTHSYGTTRASEATTIIESWVGKPCPSCRKGEIITAAEMTLHRAMVILERVSRFLQIFCPSLKTVKVRVSTGPMREGKPATFRREDGL